MPSPRRSRQARPTSGPVPAQGFGEPPGRAGTRPGALAAEVSTARPTVVQSQRRVSVSPRPRWEPTTADRACRDHRSPRWHSPRCPRCGGLDKLDQRVVQSQRRVRCAPARAGSRPPPIEPVEITAARAGTRPGALAAEVSTSSTNEWSSPSAGFGAPQPALALAQVPSLRRSRQARPTSGPVPAQGFGEPQAALALAQVPSLRRSRQARPTSGPVPAQGFGEPQAALGADHRRSSLSRSPQPALALAQVPSLRRSRQARPTSGPLPAQGFGEPQAALRSRATADRACRDHRSPRWHSPRCPRCGGLDKLDQRVVQSQRRVR